MLCLLSGFELLFSLGAPGLISFMWGYQYPVHIFGQGQLTGTQAAYLFSCWKKRHKNIKYLFIQKSIKVHMVQYTRQWLDSILRLFADDTLLYRSINTMNGSVILQIDVDKLASWIMTWQCSLMWLNIIRWGYLGRWNLRSQLMDYYIDGQKLSPYLEVMLSNDPRWNSHVENIVVKANKSLRFVRGNLYPFSENTNRSTYVTIVRPNLQYATDSSMEAVQRHAARFIKRDYNYQNFFRYRNATVQGPRSSF